jgi:hypothetical protein
MSDEWHTFSIAPEIITQAITQIAQIAQIAQKTHG